MMFHHDEDYNRSSNYPIKTIDKHLIDRGMFIFMGTIFKKDYLFSSPSTAAAIVMGRNANGLREWKLKNGMTLKEFEKPDEE
ncbi:uncharacterized protein DUF4357 [Halanaerobium saccharolyticum]|uniref:Uncharacterized protein DUF4357 n=1 Tax=Halanaerobium saccharolyticum TaxID=43595 RepID=A0A4R6SL82_9FIRM|nr:DUF4357 domain-containing protein [Halanaerobium saccharolyticum]TDQ04042.1 uncharacterized protein DUF4357 [Halanaerobium saccharolyticum]